MSITAEETEIVFTPRSQRSLLQEADLRAKLAKCQDWIGHHERKIGELEESKARQLKHSVEAGHVPDFLGRTLEELEDEKRQLAAFQEQRRACR